MYFMALKVFISAGIIAFCSWLAGAKPHLAGFIVALPLTSMIVIPLSYYEWSSPEKSTAFAQGILYAIPLSMLFFVPFLLAEKMNLGFWTCYLSGIALLSIGYFISLYFLGVK